MPRRFWLIIGVAAAFLLVSSVFVWRGFRNYRRYKKALAAASAEERARRKAAAAARERAVERGVELAAAGRTWAHPLIAE